MSRQSLHGMSRHTMKTTLNNFLVTIERKSSDAKRLLDLTLADLQNNHQSLPLGVYNHTMALYYTLEV
jgi:hypothetical protein